MVRRAHSSCAPNSIWFSPDCLIDEELSTALYTKYITDFIRLINEGFYIVHERNFEIEREETALDQEKFRKKIS
jgi:hypothetical protein